MELLIVGGAEHGRSCFYIEGEAIRFLVDCGAAGAARACPGLASEQVRALQYVFLTSGDDSHAGALPWLLEQGFAGTVVASEETLRQLPVALPDTRALSSFRAPANLSLHWGRSGCCPGSVWYELTLENRTLLFTGNYTESSLVYIADPIRRARAELAVIDCAYGADGRSPEVLRFDFLTRMAALLSHAEPVLLPVPKYGGGLELLALLRHARPRTPVYGDETFLHQLRWLQTDRFWCTPNARDALRQAEVLPLTDVPGSGVCFLTDPQLESPDARRLADAFLAAGGSLVMTGTVEPGSYSEALIQEGKMELLRCPAHQNEAQYRALLRENRFSKALADRAGAFSPGQKISL